MSRALLSLSFLGLAQACSAVEAPERARVPEVRELITAERLSAHVHELASDAMAGRRTGTPEAVAAARYLAATLEAAGVEPAGDEGTFLQAVPMGVTRYSGVPTLTVGLADGTRREAVCGIDFELSAGCGERSLERVLTARSAEEIPAEPEAGAALFVSGSSRDRRAWLRERGSGFGLVITNGSSSPGREAQARPPRDSRTIGATPAVQVRGLLLELFESGQVTSVRFAAPGKEEPLEAYNVVGWIPGAGELAGEAIVFSAHYDHIGVRSGVPAGEDAICNGADDDASGCAAVLELARAFAAGPRPARTLVFLLATGEEIGLVGTWHYLAAPVVPLERTVTNLNFEMIGRPDELAGGSGRLWLTGHELTNLGPAFAELGLAVVGDPRPEQNFFRRSDNYAFAQRGIVAQTLSSYDLHEDYHTVRDEADKLDYAHMEAGVRAAFVAARALADGSLTPSWNPGGNPAE
jgi:hypothetical protein